MLHSLSNADEVHVFAVFVGKCATPLFLSQESFSSETFVALPKVAQTDQSS